MANSKFSDLSENSSPADNDIICVSDEATGVYTSMKMKLSTLYTWVKGKTDTLYALLAGTTSASFTVDSDSITGKITITAAAGAADKTLTITNTALTDNRQLIIPNANVDLTSGSGTFPATAHGHTGTTDGAKLAQANTHESADTDSATSSLHHTIGATANSAAAGNHAHTTTYLARLLADFADHTELTIGTGAITVTQTYHSVDGEGDAADDLATINGGSEGTLLLLRPENAARNITLKNGTGNILTGTAADYTIPDDGMVILLNDGTNWRMVGGGGSGAAWDGDIADIDIDGGTDIGGALADGDLIVVDDGAGGTNRKCAMSRVKTYVGAATVGAVGIDINGGGSAITTGVKGYIRCPFAGTITKATILAETSGAIVIDVWKDTYANYPPTDADSITASAPPTISASGVKSEDSTLTDWTTTVLAGDCFGFNVDSCTSITRATLILEITR